MKTEISSFHHCILVPELSQKALHQCLLNSKLMNNKLINAKESEAMKPPPSHCCCLPLLTLPITEQTDIMSLLIWYLTKDTTRTSLAVQWLRHWAPTARGVGLIPGWGTKIPHAWWQGQKKERTLYHVGSIFTKKICMILNKSWENVALYTLKIFMVLQSETRGCSRLKEIKETWKLNIIHDPALNCGPEKIISVIEKFK